MAWRKSPQSLIGLVEEAALQDWVARSFAFVSQMPPKEKKTKKTAKKNA